MSKKIVSEAKQAYLSLGQRLGAAFHAPSRRQAQVALFVLGVVLLTTGLSSFSMAAYADPDSLTTYYNDQRIADSVNAILTYLEGTFGALVMAAAGIGAILSSAFGQYKAALGCLVVAVGAFILRSFLGTFFNDESIKG
jgi:hypothetical protein